MEMPELPDELGAAGRALWDSVTGRFQLETHEEALLVEAVRTLDHCAELDRLVRSEGRVVETSQGPRAHPALVESRQRQTFGRLLSVLRLPDGSDGSGKAGARPQHSGGVRPYCIRPSG